MTIAPDTPAANLGRGSHPLGDSSLTRAHGSQRPRPVAHCEAELAILDLTPHRDGRRPRYYGTAELKGQHGMRAGSSVYLAAGYRHRGGYARFWGTPVTHTLTEDGQ